MESSKRMKCDYYANLLGQVIQVEGNIARWNCDLLFHWAKITKICLVVNRCFWIRLQSISSQQTQVVFLCFVSNKLQIRAAYTTSWSMRSFWFLFLSLAFFCCYTVSECFLWQSNALRVCISDVHAYNSFVSIGSCVASCSRQSHRVFGSRPTWRHRFCNMCPKKRLFLFFLFYHFDMFG